MESWGAARFTSLVSGQRLFHQILTDFRFSTQSHYNAVPPVTAFCMPLPTVLRRLGRPAQRLVRHAQVLFEEVGRQSELLPYVWYLVVCRIVGADLQVPLGLWIPELPWRCKRAET